MLLEIILTIAGILNCVSAQGLACVTVYQTEGTCVKLSDCPETKNIYVANNLPNQTALEFIVSSHKICGLRSVEQEPIICCKNRTPISQLQLKISSRAQDSRILLTASNGCGVARQAGRKNFGDQIQVNTWPWLALIGYTDHNGIFSFRCGGSLISKRHVLTAAHCVNYDLTTVRLGEHNLATDTETKHIDVPVINIMSHPNYDERDDSSDITILVLGHDILFTREISPICLPLMESTENFIGYSPFIAGWGFTQNANYAVNIIQDLQLPILANQQCSGQFRESLTNNIICAGITSNMLNICPGDLGGPLMLPIVDSDREYYFYQIGILSKSKGCGRPEAPNVFTKVSSFVNWISEQVAKPI